MRRSTPPTGFSDQSRHERGYGTAWDKLRVQILRRDSSLCQPCLKRGQAKVGNIVDHITPKADGGTDDPANLQTICKDCHTDKTSSESARARGLASKPRSRATRGCDESGIPQDPSHHWNADK